MLSLVLRGTDFGPVAVLWERPRRQAQILRVVLSRPGLSADRFIQNIFPDVRPASCAEIDRVVDGIEALFAGEDIRFSLDVVRLDLCPDFQRRVLRAEHRIPRGKVSTYGRIAGRIGNHGAARAVGTALATNPFPVIVPCHRAVRSDGTIGEYQGGSGMKRALLEREGIVFDRSGRIVSPAWHY
jgi:methylated-DNA-[protein]-cysteine S-methyltransferase